MGTQGSPVKSYDYLLKFLLVGDSDVGKGEILESLQDGAAESPYAYSNGKAGRRAAALTWHRPATCRPPGLEPGPGGGRGSSDPSSPRPSGARSVFGGGDLAAGLQRKKGFSLVAGPHQVCIPGCTQRQAVGSGLRASMPCAGGR